MNLLCLLIGKSCRSDAPLTDPLIKRLETEKEWCDCRIIHLEPANYIESYMKCQELFNNFKYDLVLVSGDRIEQFGLSSAAFFNQQKIIHLGAGITNTVATYDDILRHNITLMSTIQLCEDDNSMMEVYELFNTLQIGRERRKAFIVGNPYLEGLDEISEELVPKEPYDLVLINAETLNPSEIDLFKKVAQITNEVRRKSIWIPSNPDQFKRTIGKINFDFDNLSRPLFLGLLKNCHRFISNSSSTYYEAPYFLKEYQIIRVGARNKNRSTPKVWNQDYKSSDKIVDILKKYWEENIK